MILKMHIKKKAVCHKVFPLEKSLDFDVEPKTRFEHLKLSPPLDACWSWRRRLASRTCDVAHARDDTKSCQNQESGLSLHPFRRDGKEKVGILALW